VKPSVGKEKERTWEERRRKGKGGKEKMSGRKGQKEEGRKGSR